MVEWRSTRPRDVQTMRMAMEPSVARHGPWETYGACYNPEHRWVYFSQMAVGESILLKTFDSSKDASLAARLATDERALAACTATHHHLESLVVQPSSAPLRPPLCTQHHGVFWPSRPRWPNLLCTPRSNCRHSSTSQHGSHWRCAVRVGDSAAYSQAPTHGVIPDRVSSASHSPSLPLGVRSLLALR